MIEVVSNKYAGEYAAPKSHPVTSFNDAPWPIQQMKIDSAHDDPFAVWIRGKNTIWFLAKNCWIGPKHEIESMLEQRAAEERKNSLKELAREAINCQDAVNLSGVLLGWSEAITRLRSALKGCGTSQINNHPINVMFAWKCFVLAHGSDPIHATGEDYSKAYAACKDLLGEGK